MKNQQQASTSTNDAEAIKSDDIQHSDGHPSTDDEEQLFKELDGIVNKLEARLKVLSQPTDQPTETKDKAD
jgi:hypothetical protein